MEEATAKATVLPRWLAKPIFLNPVAKLRQPLVAMLSPTIASMWAGNVSAGAWPLALKGVKRANLPGYNEFLGHVGKPNAPIGSGGGKDKRENVDDGILTPDEAADLVVGLLFAAHKNPAIGAGQTLLYLLDPEHKGHLAQVQDEVSAIKDVLAAADGKVGSVRGAVVVNKLDAIASKTYFLGLCIAEALRLTAHSIGAVRKVVAKEGIELKTEAGDVYRLPKGSYVGISHIVPHRDPTIYPKPHSFNPSRFAKRSSSADSTAAAATDGAGGAAVGDAGKILLEDDYKYTTFSHGVHRCPGRKLADLQIRLTLGLLLSRFVVELDGKPGVVDFERATLAQRSGPCMVKYLSRD